VIFLNGEQADLPAGESVVAALAHLGLRAETPGVAVAVDGEVVPRRQWESFALRDHARVEVLSAMQGG
jgi:sulfur carrier protein